MIKRGAVSEEQMEERLGFQLEAHDWDKKLTDEIHMLQRVNTTLFPASYLLDISFLHIKHD